MKSTLAAALLGCLASIAVGVPAVGERRVSSMTQVGQLSREMRVSEKDAQSVAIVDSDSVHQDSNSNTNAHSADTMETERHSHLSRRAAAEEERRKDERRRGYPVTGYIPIRKKSGIVVY